MGDLLFGGSERKEDIGLLTPEQQQFLSSILGPGISGQAGQAFQQLLGGTDPQQFEEMFQKSIVEPSVQDFQRKVVPGIKEQFLGLDESGSSSLNQALAQGATDLSTSIGSQRLNQFNTQQGNVLNALQQLIGASGQRTFQPQVEQQQGILGPIIQALGSIGGGLVPRIGG